MIYLYIYTHIYIYIHIYIYYIYIYIYMYVHTHTLTHKMYWTGSASAGEVGIVCLCSRCAWSGSVVNGFNSWSSASVTFTLDEEYRFSNEWTLFATNYNTWRVTEFLDLPVLSVLFFFWVTCKGYYVLSLLYRCKILNMGTTGAFPWA